MGATTRPLPNATIAAMVAVKAGVAGVHEAEAAVVHLAIGSETTNHKPQLTPMSRRSTSQIWISSTAKY